MLVFGYLPDSFALKDHAMFDENQKLFLGMYEVAHSAKASMLQDLEHGKPTQVRMINGFVSQIGRKHGILTPLHDKVVEIFSKIEKKELPLSIRNMEYLIRSCLYFKIIICKTTPAAANQKKQRSALAERCFFERYY